MSEIGCQQKAKWPDEMLEIPEEMQRQQASRWKLDMFGVVGYMRISGNIKLVALYFCVATTLYSR